MALLSKLFTLLKPPCNQFNILFSARQGVVIALFIIFLGIIPGIALIVFILYYAKYNLKLNWKSAPSTTYVTKCFQHARTISLGGGSAFSRPQNMHSTTSSTTSPRKVEICDATLVSTTNIDGIVRSNTITDEHRNCRTKRLSIKNLFSKNDLASSVEKLYDDSQKFYTKKPPPVPDIALKTPRRMSFKNLKKIAFSSNSGHSNSKENICSEIDINASTPTASTSDCEGVQSLSVKELAKKLNNLKVQRL